MNVKRYLLKQRKFIDEYIEKLLPLKEQDNKLSEAIRYSMVDGGKRIRAILMLEVANLLEKEPGVVIKSACGIEMIHTSTLLLDDLPSMDDALLRRGKPALHRIHGEATTILSANILLLEGIQLILDNAFENGLKLELISQMWRQLLEALGKHGIMAGQHLDLELSNQKLNIKAVENIHEKKTASLFISAINIAATLAGALPKEKDCLLKFAKNFGMAFQIRDDILSIEEKPKQTGKLSLTREVRPNYCIILGKKKADKKLKTYTEKARKSLAGFKERADTLIAITDYLQERRS